MPPRRGLQSDRVGSACCYWKGSLRLAVKERTMHAIRLGWLSTLRLEWLRKHGAPPGSRERQPEPGGPVRCYCKWLLHLGPTGAPPGSRERQPEPGGPVRCYCKWLLHLGPRGAPPGSRARTRRPQSAISASEARLFPSASISSNTSSALSNKTSGSVKHVLSVHLPADVCNTCG